MTNKQFHDRELYVFCFSLPDGNFTAYESPGLLGTNICELTLPPNDAIGQRAYDAVANAPEGTTVTMDYELPKPGTKKPAPKQRAGLWCQKKMAGRVRKFAVSPVLVTGLAVGVCAPE